MIGLAVSAAIADALPYNQYPNFGYPASESPTVRVPRTIYSPEHMRLVKLLREHREAAGVRQTELAVRVDRPQSFVSKYEAGQRRLDLVEVREICVALDIDVVELVRKWESLIGHADRRRR